MLVKSIEDSIGELFLHDALKIGLNDMASDGGCLVHFILFRLTAGKPLALD